MDLVHTEWPPLRYWFKNIEQILALRYPQDAWIVLDDGTRGDHAVTACGVPAERVQTRGPGYLLQLGAGELDADVARASLGAARRALADGQPSVAAASLGEALALWRGTPLADFGYEGFAQAEIARLEELKLAVQEEWVEAEMGRRICHVPEAGRPDKVWWLGFDCAHLGDAMPGMNEFREATRISALSERETYRTLAYVKGEVEGLARQLAAMGA